MKNLKKKTIIFIMSIMFLLPKCSFAQQTFNNDLKPFGEQELFDTKLNEVSFDCNSDLCVEDYEIKTLFLKENEKHKFSIDSVCIDLFDYSVLKSHIISQNKECNDLILSERDYAKERIKMIFDVCESQKIKLKQSLEELFIKNKDLLENNKNLKNNIKSLNNEVILYKYLAGGSAVLFLGSITYLILK